MRGSLPAWLPGQQNLKTKARNNIHTITTTPPQTNNATMKPEMMDEELRRDSFKFDFQMFCPAICPNAANLAAKI
jgi:hypothetical protein